MQLYRLAYSSTVATPLTKVDLKQILATSVINNQRAGLTGALCFSRGAFLQILEGDRYPLNATFQKISRDLRHKDVHLIGLAPTQSRLFGNWSMAFVDDTRETRAIVMKYCGTDRLMFGYMPLDEVVALVQDMLSPKPTSAAKMSRPS